MTRRQSLSGGLLVFVLVSHLTALNGGDHTAPIPTRYDGTRSAPPGKPQTETSSICCLQFRAGGELRGPQTQVECLSAIHSQCGVHCWHSLCRCQDLESSRRRVPVMVLRGGAWEDGGWNSGGMPRGLSASQFGSARKKAGDNKDGKEGAKTQAAEGAAGGQGGGKDSLSSKIDAVQSREGGRGTEGENSRQTRRSALSEQRDVGREEDSPVQALEIGSEERKRPHDSLGASENTPTSLGGGARKAAGAEEK
eukprot:257084-Rhodomonas_salina.1